MAERPPFIEQLRIRWDEGRFVSVGLDPDLDKIPQHLRKGYIDPTDYGWQGITRAFLEKIIDHTGDLVCAFKPNIAFFEGNQGGEEALEDLVNHIHSNFPTVPVIGDVKRADIGDTNRGYARMAFERYKFDAITTNPYFGHDTYPPFLNYEGKGLIVLCKTTNPGSSFYQDVPVDLDAYYLIQEKNGTPLTREEKDLAEEVAKLFDKDYEERVLQDPPVLLPLYLLVALRTKALTKDNPNIGLVVGATYPEAFAPIRRLAPDLPFLIPGIGTQGGDLEKTLKYAPDSKGQGMIINSSSAIIFASSGEDFAEAARAATLKLHNQITELRAKNG